MNDKPQAEINMVLAAGALETQTEHGHKGFGCAQICAAIASACARVGNLRDGLPREGVDNRKMKLPRLRLLRAGQLNTMNKAMNRSKG